MKNLEIEYKVMINKESFKKLEKLLSSLNYELYKQTNYYYDTLNEDIKKCGLSLRIRHIINQNKFLLTLKEKHKDGKMEYEEYLPSNDINNLPGFVKTILYKYNINNKELVNIAKLTTTRKEYDIEDSKLCLDHSVYYNKEDYEIECESTSMEKAKRIVETLLKENDIEYTISDDSKVARAIKNKDIV